MTQLYIRWLLFLLQFNYETIYHTRRHLLLLYGMNFNIISFVITWLEHYCIILLYLIL